MQGRQVLLVGPKKSSYAEVHRILGRAGWAVITVGDDMRAWEHFDPQTVELVVTVLDLPGFDARRTLRAVRSQANTPFVVVGPHDETLLTYYLQNGADDYVGFGESDAVLLARVGAAVRCNVPGQPFVSLPEGYSDGYLQVSLAGRRVTVEGREVPLTPKEFNLLYLLVRYGDQTLTYDQILLHVWDQTCLDRPHYVHTYIGRLREKLERKPDAPQYLQTVYGVGYKFVTQEGRDGQGR